MVRYGDGVWRLLLAMDQTAHQIIMKVDVIAGMKGYMCVEVTSCAFVCSTSRRRGRTM